MKINNVEFLFHATSEELSLIPILKVEFDRVLISVHNGEEISMLKSRIGKMLKTQNTFYFSTLNQVEKFIDLHPDLISDYRWNLEQMEYLNNCVLDNTHSPDNFVLSDDKTDWYFLCDECAKKGDMGKIIKNNC